MIAAQALLQRKPKQMRITFNGAHRSRRVRERSDSLLHGAPRRHGGQRLCGRVRRLRDSRAADRGAHDDLQHVDRARRALRHRGAGRHDDRVCRGPPVRADRAPHGSAQSRTGARFHPTPDARFDREYRDRLQRRSRRKSPGATRRRKPSASMSPCRIRQRSRIRAGARRSSARMPTWISRPGATLEGAADRLSPSSARAPTARLSDLEAAARVVRGRKVHKGVTALAVPGLDGGQGSRGSRRTRQDLCRSGIRVAQRGLLDVRRQQRRPCCRRASARSPRPTATSSIGKARTAARILRAPRWWLPRRSAGASPMCASCWRGTKRAAPWKNSPSSRASRRP